MMHFLFAQRGYVPPAFSRYFHFRKQSPSSRDFSDIFFSDIYPVIRNPPFYVYPHAHRHFRFWPARKSERARNRLAYNEKWNLADECLPSGRQPMPLISES
jgi:hypothetical protein